MRAPVFLTTLSLLSVVPAAGAQQLKSAPPPAKPEVRTIALTLTDADQYQVPIPLRPVRAVRIVAPTTGYIARLSVGVGEVVKAEHMLAQMDNRREHIQVNSLQEKVRLLETQGPSSGLALIDARAELQLAELALENTRARAPFAGKVYDVFVTPGQFVTVGEPLLSLADSSSLVATVPVRRENYQKGGPIALQVDGRNVSGTVVDLLPLSGQMEKLYELGGSLAGAYVSIPNAAEALKAGQLVHSEVVPEDPVTRVPSEVLQVSGSQAYVRVARSGAVRFVNVTVLGRVGRGNTRVSGEFLPGDELIAYGPDWLTDGAELGGVAEQKSAAPVDRGPPAKSSAGSERRRRAE